MYRPVLFTLMKQEVDPPPLELKRINSWVRDAAPAGSENRKENAWEDPLPDAGETETAEGGGVEALTVQAPRETMPVFSPVISTACIEIVLAPAKAELKVIAR